MSPGQRVGIPIVLSSPTLANVSLWIVAHTVDLKYLFTVILTCISLVTNDSASLVAQMVKKLPAMWEASVRSLGWEDPLEKEMATHSSILAWIIPWTEEPGGYSCKRAGHD